MKLASIKQYLSDSKVTQEQRVAAQAEAFRTRLLLEAQKNKKTDSEKKADIFRDVVFKRTMVDGKKVMLQG